MAKDRSDPELDRELPDLPPELRWREWMRRIEAVLFASAAPVPREDLARVVGQGASVDLLVEDLAADLDHAVGGPAEAWQAHVHRVRPMMTAAIPPTAAYRMPPPGTIQRAMTWLVAMTISQANPIAIGTPKTFGANRSV